MADKKKLSNKATVIIAVVLGVIILAATISATGSKNDPETETSREQPSETKTVAQDDVEEFCQDAGLLRKYITDNVSIINVDNYNAYYEDQGIYNGVHLHFLSWNGKNRTNDAVVSFSCDVEEGEDGLNLSTLVIDGVTVYDKNPEL